VRKLVIRLAFKRLGVGWGMSSERRSSRRTSQTA